VDRLDFDDVELTYQLHDGGERVVLVHASPFVSWYAPLVERLTGYSILHYRRCVREPANGRYRQLTVAEDAAICGRLMDHVGWDTAHIVGHSYGALVALQLALDTRGRVGSVALLEPAARGISNSDQLAAALVPVLAAYTSGDTAEAVDGFLRDGCGDGYAPFWTECCQAPLPRRFARLTCSSRRRCPPCSSGASVPATQSASRSPCSMCSERRALGGSWKEANSYSPGSLRPSASRCPRPGISCRCKTRQRWRTV
jgi:pimeloyl-ACP methyl ester carboxylesterase